MNDLITDIGFALCILGLIAIISFGVFLPATKEKLYNKIIVLGSILSVIGGLIILARIA